MNRLNNQPETFVVQVGAGDGVQGDVLYPHLRCGTWQALLLEPLSHVFEHLVANYRDMPHVRCKRLAVADHDGTQSLYFVGDRDGLPWWADQLGSFSKTVVLSHSDRLPDLASRLDSESVPCLTVATLVQRFAITHIDLLIVDVEGYDACVVEQFLNLPLRPTCLLFEHKHLPPNLLAELESRILRDGYTIARGPADCLCWHGSADATK